MTQPRKAFLDWWETARERLSMHAEPVPLHTAQPWKVLSDADGPIRVTRGDERFHEGIAITSHEPRGKVARFMLRTTIRDDDHALIFLLAQGSQFLVQAKAEPGNRSPGRVALTCTLQSSFSALTISTPPFWDFVKNLVTAGVGISVPQDPAMFYEKVNRVGFYELSENDLPANASLPPEFFRATLSEIAYMSQQSLVSEHLLQTLAMRDLT